MSKEKEVLAYAITHAPKGQKGGPYEAKRGGYGDPWPTLKGAFRWDGERDIGPGEEDLELARMMLKEVRCLRPHARVIRIVRARPTPCPVHADQEHGREAEELRRGIEKILADALPAWDYIEQGDRDDDVICARDLKRLIERVDARDSVAYLERKTRLSPLEIAAMVGAQERMPIVPTQQPSEASAVEVLREMVAWDDLCASPEAEYEAVLERARSVLATSGPDPMPVVRAAMRETEAERVFNRAIITGRSVGAEADDLIAAREERAEAVGKYTKAGGK